MSPGIKESIVKNVSFSLSLMRAMNFTAQSSLLPVLDKILDRKKENPFERFKGHIETALPRVQKVLHKDAENIANGLYPPTVLFEELPWVHYLRVPMIFADAIRAHRQRLNKETAQFEAKESDFVKEAPDYFKRNFHFQKGGYLSDDSARLYDHQVEILFSGTAQAMRRQIIPELKSYFANSKGERLKFLELGSGTGSLTRSMALAFPKAQITCVDISPHYISYSQRKLSAFKRINYVQGQAEDLAFKDNSFDAVFSCYLFHELPEKIRGKVLSEKLRVLKSGGYLGVVDSLQKDDDSTLNWALEQFPIDFHEPFYKNYTERPIEDAIEKLGLKQISTELHFLTKVVSSVKL